MLRDQLHVLPRGMTSMLQDFRADSSQLWDPSRSQLRHACLRCQLRSRHPRPAAPRSRSARSSRPRPAPSAENIEIIHPAKEHNYCAKPPQVHLCSSPYSHRHCPQVGPRPRRRTRRPRSAQQGLQSHQPLAIDWWRSAHPVPGSPGDYCYSSLGWGLLI